MAVRRERGQREKRERFPAIVNRRGLSGRPGEEQRMGSRGNKERVGAGMAERWREEGSEHAFEAGTGSTRSQGLVVTVISGDQGYRAARDWCIRTVEEQNWAWN